MRRETRRARTSTPTAHVHLSAFQRRLITGTGESREVTLAPAEVRWLDAQTHSGHNTGETPTHVLFVELKEPRTDKDLGTLGPS